MDSNESQFPTVASVDFPSSTLVRNSFPLRDINEVNQSTEPMESILPGQSIVTENQSQNTNSPIVRGQGAQSQQNPAISNSSASGLIAAQFTTRNIWKKFSIASLIYHTPLTLSLLVTIFVDRSFCSYLTYWTYGQAFIQAVLIVLNLTLLILLSGPESSSKLENVMGLVKLTNCLLIVWFIMGVTLMFGFPDHTCATELPNMFRISLAILLFEVGILGFGLLFSCCSINILFIMYIMNVLKPKTNHAGWKMIRTLTTSKKYDGDLPQADAMCAICLGEYVVGEDLRYLPCKHHFHTSCIDKWLKDYNKNCPFCKAEIDKKNYNNV